MKDWRRLLLIFLSIGWCFLGQSAVRPINVVYLKNTAKPQLIAAVGRQTPLTNPPRRNKLLPIDHLPKTGSISMKAVSGPAERQLFTSTELLTLLNGLPLSQPLAFTPNPEHPDRIEALLPDSDEPPLFEAVLQPNKDDPNKTALVFQNWEVSPHSTPGQTAARFALNEHNHRYFRHTLGPDPASDAGLKASLAQAVQAFQASYGEEGVLRAEVSDIAISLIDWLKEQKLDVKSLFNSNRSEYYSVLQRTPIVEIMQFIVYERSDDDIMVVFIESDHEFEFLVPRRGFRGLEPALRELLTTRVLSQDFSGKLNLDKIAALLAEKLKRNCVVGHFEKRSEVHTGVVQIVVGPEPDCFAGKTTLGLIRFTAGFLQFVHLKVEGEYFNAEYIVPCLAASFDKQLDSVLAESQQIGQRIHQTFSAAQSEHTIDLPTLQKLIQDKLKVKIDFAGATEQTEQFTAEGTSENGEIRCLVFFEGGRFRIRLIWTHPEGLKGSFAAEVDFPKTNAYDQTAHIQEEFQKFLNKQS